MKGGGRCICHGISNIVYIKTTCIQTLGFRLHTCTFRKQNTIHWADDKKIVWLIYRNIEQLEIHQRKGVRSYKIHQHPLNSWDTMQKRQKG